MGKTRSGPTSGGFKQEKMCWGWYPSSSTPAKSGRVWQQMSVEQSTLVAKMPKVVALCVGAASLECGSTEVIRNRSKYRNRWLDFVWYCLAKIEATNRIQ